MLAQKIAARGSQPDHHLAPFGMLARGKAAVHRVLPYRQARARGAPRVDHVAIGPRRATDPFQKVEDQRVEIVSLHDLLTASSALLSTRPSASEWATSAIAACSPAQG